MITIRSTQIIYWSILIVHTIAIILSCQHVLFWDTIQFGALHPKFFLETNFTQFIPPADFDSGHPPLFGLYLALFAKLFGGISLPLVHVAMLPWLWLSVTCCYQVGQQLWGNERAGIWLIFWSFCPIWSAQSILVSPDIVLMAAFWMALSAIIRGNKELQLTLAVIILCTVSMRGMMLALAFLIWKMLVMRTQRYENQPKNSIEACQLKKGIFYQLYNYKHIIYPFLPGAIVGVAYLVWHYVVTGWIGYHVGSAWAAAFERVDATGFLKNILLLGWRLCDFGMISIWLVSAFFLFKKPVLHHAKWWVLLLILLVILTPSMLLHKGLIAHRYLLPLYACISVIAANYLFQFKRSNLYISMLSFFLLLGNFWIYPTPISNGWDSTLAHIPYYQVRKDMIAWMDANNIPIDQTGSAFPNRRSFADTELNASTRQFAAKNFATNKYILYSNIFNDFEVVDIDTLQNWQKIHEIQIGQVFMILYKKPDTIH